MVIVFKKNNILQVTPYPVGQKLRVRNNLLVTTTKLKRHMDPNANTERI